MLVELYDSILRFIIKSANELNINLNFYMEKENLSLGSNNYSENEIKKQLYDSMKASGILDGLKSNLR